MERKQNDNHELLLITISNIHRFIVLSESYVNKQQQHIKKIAIYKH